MTTPTVIPRSYVVDVLREGQWQPFASFGWNANPRACALRFAREDWGTDTRVRDTYTGHTLVIVRAP